MRPVNARFVNSATPFSKVTWLVPLNDPLAPDCNVAVTVEELFKITVLLLASCNVSCGCVEKFEALAPVTGARVIAIFVAGPATNEMVSVSVIVLVPILA